MGDAKQKHALYRTFYIRDTEASVINAIHRLCFKMHFFNGLAIAKLVCWHSKSKQSDQATFKSWNIQLFCSVEEPGIVSRVCGCRTERKTAPFPWTLGCPLSWEWNVRLQVEPNLGKENGCPFRSWIDICIFPPFFFLLSFPYLFFSSFIFLFFPHLLLVSLPPSLIFCFHFSQMSLQFNLLYCCNRVIHLFGQSLVSCRQMNICRTIHFTSEDQRLAFIPLH